MVLVLGDRLVLDKMRQTTFYIIILPIALAEIKPNRGFMKFNFKTPTTVREEYLYAPFREFRFDREHRMTFS